MNVNGNHWLAGVIDFKNGGITFFDSLAEENGSLHEIWGKVCRIIACKNICGY